jgi:hypothetical protein
MSLVDQSTTKSLWNERSLAARGADEGAISEKCQTRPLAPVAEVSMGMPLLASLSARLVGSVSRRALLRSSHFTCRQCQALPMPRAGITPIGSFRHARE